MLKTVSAFQNAIGALNYKGSWDASTNTPTLTSGVGNKGDYYVVSVAGTTNLDGTNLWSVGDWAVFNGSIWQKVDGGTNEAFNSIIVTNLTGYMYANNTSPVTASTTIPVANVSGAVANTVNVIAGTGLSGGGALTGNVTLNLANTAVSAGTYGSNGAVAQVTINGQGQITSASNVGITIPVANVSGAVANTVNVIAGTGLSGGGALTGNVTINLANTSVVAGSYTNTNLTVDAQGRITAAANGTSSGVTSFSADGTGLTPNVATTGAVTLGGILDTGYGGTNSTATPTAGAVAYGNGTSYLFTAAGTAGQYLQSTGSGTPTWSTPSTGSFQPAYYGTFVSTSNQANGGSTTANAVNFDTTVLANGVSITSSNQITFANAGQYIIAFELAVNNSVGSNPTISSWLALNGTNIANTRSDMTIQGGANNPQLLEQQWIVNVTAGQYIQIYWSCSATTVSLLYTAAGASPTRPAGPSAIVNCAFIPPSGQNVVINSSTITGGTSGNILYDNAGTIGEKGVSGTGNVVLVTSSTLTNVNISSVAVTFPNSYLANSTATLGNATITLGSTTTSVGNLTLANANITSVAATFPNSYLSNSSVTLGNTAVSLGATATSLGNLTLNNVTIPSGSINVQTINCTSTTAASATFATSSLPLVPAGYIQVNLNGTVVKVPYYAV